MSPGSVCVEWSRRHDKSTAPLLGVWYNALRMLIPGNWSRRRRGRELGCGAGPALGLALLLASMLTGCPPHRIEFGPQGEITDPEALLHLISEAEAKTISVNGEAKVHLETPEAKGAFSMFIALSRPALVHLEPLDFFGRPQGVLVVNGQQFGLYQGQENRYYRGPASPENVSRFLPIVLPAPELVQVMLGVVPRITAGTAELVTNDKCGCYVLTLHNGGVTQRLEVDPRLFRVTKSELRGINAYDLELGDFEEHGPTSFPKHIMLRSEAAHVEVDLRYGDVTLNEAPDLTMFDLEPPEGAEVVDVDAQGRPEAGSSTAP